MGGVGAALRWHKGDAAARRRILTERMGQTLRCMASCGPAVQAEELAREREEQEWWLRLQMGLQLPVVSVEYAVAHRKRLNDGEVIRAVYGLPVRRSPTFPEEESGAGASAMAWAR